MYKGKDYLYGCISCFLHLTFIYLISNILQGDFTNRGWGGSKIGNFWGGPTIQGIVPYFYHSILPGQALELNRCEYNCMVDNPYYAHKKKGVIIERCLDKQLTCQDCRLQVFEKVKSAHFTICQKPWTCTKHVNPKNRILCKKLHDEWYALRDEFERSAGLSLAYRSQTSDYYKESLGMCSGYGNRHYIPINVLS